MFPPSTSVSVNHPLYPNTSNEAPKDYILTVIHAREKTERIYDLTRKLQMAMCLNIFKADEGPELFRSTFYKSLNTKLKSALVKAADVKVGDTPVSTEEATALCKQNFQGLAWAKEYPNIFNRISENSIGNSEENKNAKVLLRKIIKHVLFSTKEPSVFTPFFRDRIKLFLKQIGDYKKHLASIEKQFTCLKTENNMPRPLMKPSPPTNPNKSRPGPRPLRQETQRFSCGELLKPEDDPHQINIAEIQKLNYTKCVAIFKESARLKERIRFTYTAIQRSKEFKNIKDESFLEIFTNIIQEMANAKLENKRIRVALLKTSPLNISLLKPFYKTVDFETSRETLQTHLEELCPSLREGVVNCLCAIEECFQDSPRIREMVIKYMEHVSETDQEVDRYRKIRAAKIEAYEAVLEESLWALNNQKPTSQIRILQRKSKKSFSEEDLSAPQHLEQRIKDLCSKIARKEWNPSGESSSKENEYSVKNKEYKEIKEQLKSRFALDPKGWLIINRSSPKDQPFWLTKLLHLSPLNSEASYSDNDKENSNQSILEATDHQIMDWHGGERNSHCRQRDLCHQFSKFVSEKFDIFKDERKASLPPNLFNDDEIRYARIFLETWNFFSTLHQVLGTIENFEHIPPTLRKTDATNNPPSEGQATTAPGLHDPLDMDDDFFDFLAHYFLMLNGMKGHLEIISKKLLSFQDCNEIHDQLYKDEEENDVNATDKDSHLKKEPVKRETYGNPYIPSEAIKHFYATTVGAEVKLDVILNHKGTIIRSLKRLQEEARRSEFSNSPKDLSTPKASSSSGEPSTPTSKVREFFRIKTPSPRLRAHSSSTSFPHAPS